MKKPIRNVVIIEENEFNKIVEGARECGREEERKTIMEFIKEKCK
jgi:hypothetical protein